MTELIEVIFFSLILDEDEKADGNSTNLFVHPVTRKHFKAMKLGAMDKDCKKTYNDCNVNYADVMDKLKHWPKKMTFWLT